MTVRPGWISLLLLLAGPGALLAHGRLERSEPAEDARLTRAPSELRLTFTEAPELAVSGIELVGPDGRLVALGPVGNARDSARVLVAAIRSPLVDGRYEVRWRAAMGDGHPLRGSFVFTIAPGAEGLSALASPDTTRQAPPSAEPASTDPARRATFVLVRWVSFVALVLAIASPAFVVLVLPRIWTAGDDVVRSVAPGSRDRARRIGIIAAGALLLTAAGRLSAQSIGLYGLPESMNPQNVATILTDTTWGAAWIAQTLAAAALAATLAFAGRSGGGWMFALLLSLPLALGAALSGHAASADAGVALAVALDATHVLAASTWLGGLALLVLAALPATVGLNAPRGALASALVNAFSPVALVCGILVIATGTIAASLHFHGPRELFTSEYGRVLLIKLALVILALAAGAYNWRRVRPALADGGDATTLRRVAGAELGSALFVLLATAVLVATPPPR